jgi:hypothetical protein
MTLSGGIFLCVVIGVLFLVTVILAAVATDESSGEAGGFAVVCGVLTLGFLILLTYFAVSEFGRARDNAQIETGVVQEVVAAFTLEDDESFVLLRKWGSGDEAVYYRLAVPMPDGAKCVLFREGVVGEDGRNLTRMLPDAVTCPVRQPLPAEKP